MKQLEVGKEYNTFRASRTACHRPPGTTLGGLAFSCGECQRAGEREGDA